MSAFDPLPPPSAIQRALPVGTRIEGIEIGPAVAEDAATVTYRATGPRGEFLALTEYMPAQLALREPDGALLSVADAGFRAGLAAFVDEARVLMRADHPSLIGVLDVIETRGTAYRSARWVDGARLVDVRRQMTEPPDEEALRDLLEGLLGGLNAWQREGGLHGAVTPANILLLADDRPVLLGPGRALQAIASERVASLMTSVEPNFAPVEQIAPTADIPLGPTADYYALAGVIRYCLSGQLPPPALGGAQLPRESMRDLARRVRQSWPKLHYGEALLDTLEAALSHRPEERPQSVAQFRAWLNTGPGDVVAPARDAAAAPPPREAAAPPPITIEPIGAMPPGPPPAAPPRRPTRAAAPPIEPIGGFATLGSIPPPERDTEPTASFFGIDPPDSRTDHFERFDRIEHDVRRSTTRPPPPKRRRWGALTATAIVALLVVAGVAGVREYDRRLEADRTLEIARGALSPSPQPASAAAPPTARPAPQRPLELPAEPTAAGPAPAAPVQAAPQAPAQPPAQATAAPAQAAPPAAQALPQGALPQGTVPQAVAPRAAVPQAAAPQAPAPTPVPQSSVPTVQVPTQQPAVPAQGNAAPPRVSAAPRQGPRQAAPPASPREVCGPRSEFSLYRCMTQQCAQLQWRFHPQCERLRRFDRVD